MKLSVNMFKKSLLVIVFLFLFFPILQNNLNFFKAKELNGVFNHASDIKFSFTDWLNQSFQKEKGFFLNENFGSRNLLVRVNNQIRFNLFKKAAIEEVLLGKNGYFFGNTYLRSFCGEDFVGIDTLINKCRLVKELQDRLEQRGQIFLPILAPNKVRVLNEFLPNDICKKNISNYEILISLFKKFNIKYIDFNAHFCQAYKKAKYPLYTKFGTHWSIYGHTLATDSIINYLNFNYKLNTRKMVWDDIVLSDSLRDPDNDLVDAMNLLFQQQPFEAAYPMVSYPKNKTESPSLLVIGDSFNFGLEKTNFHNNVFNDYKFLYYFKQVFPNSDDPMALYKLNLMQEINNHKVILLVTAEFNIAEYGWGFLEKATGLLNGKIRPEDLEYDNVVYMMKSTILNDKSWITKIKEQAERENKNFDSLLNGTAVYLADIKIFKENSYKNLQIKLLKDRIKKDADWMKQINVKAKEKNISIDSMATLDAIWQLNQIK